MSGFIILDTPICYVKAPDKKPSHDAHLTNKFEMKEITSITAVKEYFTDNTFELYITIVAMYLCSITKRQSTKQERLPLVAQKTCDHTLRLSATCAFALQHPPTSTTNAGILENSYILPKRNYRSLCSIPLVRSDGSLN